jgi:hypothetical protein
MSAEQKHSQMLGQIACLVEDFVRGEETTLQGVAKLKALYCDAKARLAWEYVERLDEEARDE